MTMVLGSENFAARQADRDASVIRVPLHELDPRGKARIEAPIVSTRVPGMVGALVGCAGADVIRRTATLICRDDPPGLRRGSWLGSPFEPRPLPMT